MFKRKAFEKLKYWKEKKAPKYAVLLEGARRVGKSTIAEEFAKQEYKSYIKIDFANVRKEILDVFEDIAEPDIFFLRLQTATGITLHKRESVIIFDEIQLMPKVRQAIKYLVADGRYDYIETGSLISIKKNVKDIVIPSEEIKIQVYPMDYEEFMWATGNETYQVLKELYKRGKAVGNSLNRKLMRDFRVYMAVGGMPQAVAAYVEGKNFTEIDEVKREIINLYKDDFFKIDGTGLIGRMYESVPTQLATDKRSYVISAATGKKKVDKDIERLYNMLDSKTVLPCYNVLNPSVTLSQTMDNQTFKLYLADTGLFTTMIFSSSGETDENIYTKLLSDSLPADLGYLYENAVAQVINAAGRPLYYHTWRKDNVSRYFEIDFLVASKTKIVPIEVKSSGLGMHKSITEFQRKYSKNTAAPILLSQKDVGQVETLKLYPIYMLPYILEDL
jgi:possible ATPase